MFAIGTEAPESAFWGVAGRDLTLWFAISQVGEKGKPELSSKHGQHDVNLWYNLK
jgi:hypothetical protein